MNGRFVRAAEATIPADDRGFLLGDGIFETIRVADGNLQQCDRHMARLSQGLEMLHFPFIHQEALVGDMVALLQRNAMKSGALRLTISRGSGPRGLTPPHLASPHYIITTHDTPQTMMEVKLAIARFPKDHLSPLAVIKHTNYLPAILARCEAAEQGFDDALFLNSEGYVAEASAANIIALFGDRLVTPPVQDGALPGISRGRLLEKNLCSEKSLTADDLAVADAIWLSSSLGLVAVSHLRHYEIPRNATLQRQLTKFLFG
ncbi:aminotransferase class IV [Candidatus Kirkpatrickella diaphorinae]|uniref:Probable branched-chain-amino-acid aminotransferase n=1 Tax=Candidatus Kirkpatrickella diaphorinae TaxID=2984322 RepID=A0ABY6GIL9_9PROT|nr:aminotransferase class IV [Candidatus Kirkpatrickella diaphorinae]UYH51363.1 aminotransferase class IV [Candidatus Kirkpatrickella diaphorinae]